jgi:hypothetical protein
MRYLLYIALTIGLVLGCTKKVAKTHEKGINDSVAFAKVRNYINDPANCTTITWIDSVYTELDAVAKGQPVDVSWRFKNTGTKPMIIANVTTSCDCTVVERPKKAIAPGGSGIIKAEFDTKGLQGWQRKDVYVLVNNKANLIQTLSFAVNVLK